MEDSQKGQQGAKQVRERMMSGGNSGPPRPGMKSGCNTMYCIASSVFCLPLLLNKDGVQLPLAVPQSLEQLHMFPIAPLGNIFRVLRRAMGTKEVHVSSDNEVSQLRSSMQYDSDTLFVGTSK